MSPTPDVQAHLDRIDRDGFTIVEGAFSADYAEALLVDLARLERELAIGFASNDFEGRCTRRIYNLLVHGARYQAIPVHPRVLPIVDGVLDAGCLVSSLSSTPTTSSYRCRNRTCRSCATRCGHSPISPRITARRV
jgi:hypothetical protein